MISVKNNKISRAYKDVVVLNKDGSYRKVDVGFDRKHGRYHEIVYNADRTKAYFSSFVSEKYILNHLEKRKAELDARKAYTLHSEVAPEIHSEPLYRKYGGFLGRVGRRARALTCATAAGIALATMTFWPGCNKIRTPEHSSKKALYAETNQAPPQIPVSPRPMAPQVQLQDALPIQAPYAETNQAPPQIPVSPCSMLAVPPVQKAPSTQNFRAAREAQKTHYTNEIKVNAESEYVSIPGRELRVLKTSPMGKAYLAEQARKQPAGQTTSGDKTKSESAMDNLAQAADNFTGGLWLIGPTAFTGSQIPSGAQYRANDGDFKTPIENTGKGLSRFIGNIMGTAATPYELLAKNKILPFSEHLPEFSGWKDRCFGKGLSANLGGIFMGAKMATLDGLIDVGGYPDNFYGPILNGSKKMICAGTELAKAPFNATSGIMIPEVNVVPITILDIINHGLTLEGMAHSIPENIDAAWKKEGWRIPLEQAIGYFWLYSVADSALGNSGGNNWNLPGRTGGSGTGVIRTGGSGTAP